MERKIDYKRQFREMSYKTHEDAEMVVDTVIEKISSCKDIKGLYRTLLFIPMGNKDFLDKVNLKSAEWLRENRIIIIPDPFVRNLKFKIRCILPLGIVLGSVVGRQSVNISFFRASTSDIQDCFNLPDEIQCSKSIYKVMDIIRKMQDERIYEKFKKIPEEYQNLILLEIKTLVVLLTKCTQKLTQKKISSEKIDRMIEEVEKIRKRVPMEESEDEAIARKIEYEIWNMRGKVRVFRNEIDSIEERNKKGELDILVDEHGVVYFNRDKVDELKNTQILYYFLLYFLKNKGVGGSYKNLFFEVWPEGRKEKFNPHFKFNDSYKQRVIRMKNSLNTLFKEYKLEEIMYEYNKYRLPEDFEFYVIEKI